MNKKVKIVTIGAGSSYTPELAEGLINNFKNMPIKEWWLVDIDENDGPEKVATIYGLVKRMFKKAGLEDVIIKKTLNFVEAIKDGADFVTTQFRVGGSNARIKDELIPIQHKMLGQETNGIGGMFKALRTIPVIWDIIDKIKKYANGAWMMNFTNPSGIVAEAVLGTGRYDKFIGLCNLPIYTRIAVADVMNIPSWKDLRVDAAGLNHFVYFTKFTYKGKELMPQLKSMIKSGELTKAINVKNIDDIDWDPALVYGLDAIPCSYHKYYYKRDYMIEEEIKAFKTKTVRAQIVQQIEKKLFKKYRDPNLNTKPKELEQRGGAYYSTVAVGVMNAVYNNTNEEFAVSSTNKKNVVKNLPTDWTVEATVKVGKNGTSPVDRDINAPKNAIGNLFLMKQYEKAVVKAVEEKSYDLALFAAQINPLSHDDVLAREVFGKLYKAHIQYLEYLKK